jgi:glycosyltransferase involved in cell wall biosynthesis
MKLGTPVIISKQSGVSEIVKHALKIDFWDIDQMAHYILSVLQHPGLKSTLSENGRIEADRITWADAAARSRELCTNWCTSAPKTGARILQMESVADVGFAIKT